jgi:signal transduction histidine kinase
MTWPLRFGAHRQERGQWLLLLLLFFGVVAPTGAVFWFMREAVNTQSEAIRQRVTEGYRGQLRLLRDRVDDWWRARAAAMQGQASFSALLRDTGADTVISLDPNGAARYPAPPALPDQDPTLGRVDWAAALQSEAQGRWEQNAVVWARLGASEKNPALAATARQGQIRCLVRAGQKAAALHAIATYFTGGRLAQAADPSGRRIAADEFLLALRLSKHGDSRFAPIAQRLVSLVNDYDTPMPASQRLFLMSELHSIAPEAAVFPNEPAERLAAQFLETERPRPGELALETSGVRNLWKLTSPDHGAIALYRSETITAAVNRILAQTEARGAKFEVLPPGRTSSPESITAGSMLPGWQLSFILVDARALEDAGRRRMTVYLWVGYVAIAAVAIIGVWIGQSVRREFHLARLKTDLVAAVSHELKTPLASMQVLLESLLDEPGASPKTTREYLELIAAENHRLARLIENLLTFSRIERNRQRFDFAPTKPADIVAAALAAMQERLNTPDCHLDVDVDQDLPKLQADGDALIRVLINLLDNAYKYSPGEKRISLRVSRENDRVRFEVADNGIGIAPRDQKKIFRRFYQVDQRLARETGGCGLGLSIVDYIVRAHGGTISLESKPGAGSRFRVALPYISAAKEAVV